MGIDRLESWFINIYEIYDSHWCGAWRFDQVTKIGEFTKESGSYWFLLEPPVDRSENVST